MGCAAPVRHWHPTSRNRTGGATGGDARACLSFRRPGHEPAVRRGDSLNVEKDADRRSTRRRDACGRRGRNPG
ncbi:hypothetical protein ACN2C6_08480 [Caulobacter sp. ErkDOM-YI]|uniref:hypothetical protein n=1 Tax=unclassified Caulobacter TaxID=2648921 RepID=UPI003AF6B182